MPGVVSVTYRPAAFVDGQRAVPTLTDGLGREQLGAFVDLVRSGLGELGEVVVVYPAWAAEPTLQRLQTVRAALDTTSLVAYASPAPPLAGAVLVSLVSALAAHLPTGVLLAALPVLERQLITVTWLARLSGLEDPSPTVWQHLLSLWPTTRFAVSSWPRPQVRRITARFPTAVNGRRVLAHAQPPDAVSSWPQPQVRRITARFPGAGPEGRLGATGPHRASTDPQAGAKPRDPGVTLPQPRSQVGLAVADHGGDLAWVGHALHAALGTPRVVAVEPPPESPRWWGSARLTECVVYPLDVQATAAAVSRGLRRGACAWCGHVVAAARCPFCGLPSGGPAVLRFAADEDQPAEAPAPGALIAGTDAPNPAAPAHPSSRLLASSRDARPGPHEEYVDAR